MRRLAAVILLAACGPDKWETQHEAQCTAWLQRARNASDSITVEVGCATQKQARKAEIAASTAAGLAAGAMASGASRK